jgi:sugar O-acyltransferase (sialic acid O-acetyltransferase NeuD family)
MTKPQLILIGAGGHALSCIDVIEQQGLFNVAGLVCTSGQIKTTQLDYGYSVIGVDDDLSSLAKFYRYALIVVGQIQSADSRIRLYKKVQKLGFQFPKIIAPTAYVSRRSIIGPGTIVMHAATVNAGAVIGSNCIINSRSVIEHGVKIGDHCHISTGAMLNGDVTVGSASFVGSGSVVMQGIAIGKNCLVGMHLGLRHDLNDGAQFMRYVQNE